MGTVPDDEARVRGGLERILYVAQDPTRGSWIAGLLSLAVPGLGQMYIGQHVKGVVLFFGSALLCFGGGLANVVVALDAATLAGVLRRRDLGRFEMSIWLVMVRWAMQALRSVIPSFPEPTPQGRPLRVDGQIRLPRVEEVGATGEAAQWVEDGRAEHASVATFARLSLELMALGAPPSLVRRAHEAALDEIRHAEICFDTASDLLGREVRPGPLAGADGPLRTTPTSLALASLVDGCLGEGFATVMLEALAKRTSDPERAAVLTQIADDERRHAELAWSVLGWAIESGGPTVAASVLAQLPLLPARVRDDGRLPSAELAALWASTRREVATRARALAATGA
jgi:rubrerythrin